MHNHRERADSSVVVMWDLTRTKSTDYAIGSVAALVLLHYIRNRKRDGSSLPLPPGPPRLPIIGNLHQMPLSHLWEKAVEWGKQYGDIIYVENAGDSTLIINSYEVAVELLTKRSAIYSSRPHMVMNNELLDWGWPTTALPYGDALRRHRGYLHRFFQTSEALNYYELQGREVCVMLNGLLTSPGDYASHIRRLPGAVILRNVYGYEVQTVDDPMVKLGEKVMRLGGQARLYFFLNHLPWLKHLPAWFPGVTFPKVAKEGRALTSSFKIEPHERAKKEFIEGTGKECMTSILLEENMREDGSVHDEVNISNAASVAYLAGSDTSVTATMTFILAMLKNPDKQRRAQEEIDAVIGSDRLPDISDWGSLPYVQAVCTETLRWEPVLPFALPHRLDEEDEYKGYRIPKGTMVLPNVWAISRDPKRYSDPLSFKPERWIPGATGEPVPTPRPQDYVFGFGRRVCSGQNWAEHIFFLTAASILAAFNIEKAIGPDGKEIPPNDDFVPGVTRTLGPSQCRITPRSDKAASLVRQAYSLLS
ncbi:cytochrome P450 [Schizopora paradoxa]|uniref:Cytochrome P450 n=1 Tax=Schizopora paradoxa TaxID=27342 RepID=A0A0H2S9B9_9AGAM|nr:cytochrome P450 [Schizopora paradoxa]